MGCYGEPYRLEFESSDATTAAEVTLYDSEGNERPLAENEYVRLENVNIFIANAVDQLDLFDDVDEDGNVDDGERLVTVGTNTTGDDAETHDVPFGGQGKYCSTGHLPKVLAAASGQVVVTGVVYVHKAGTPAGTPDWKQQFGQ